MIKSFGNFPKPENASPVLSFVPASKTIIDDIAKSKPKTAIKLETKNRHKYNYIAETHYKLTKCVLCFIIKHNALK